MIGPARLTGLGGILCAVCGCQQLLGEPVPGGAAPRDAGDAARDATSDISGGDVLALGSVVEQADGTTAVRLELYAATGAIEALVGVTTASVSTGEVRVGLATTAVPGVFEATSSRTSGLAYAPGRSYLFAFSYVSAAGREVSREALVTAPEERVDLAIPDAPVRITGEAVEVALLNATDGGLLRVIGPDGETYRSASAGDGREVGTVLAQLRSVTGPFEEIPGSAFPATGTYAVELTGLELATGASGLAAGSWFGAGNTVRIEIDVR